MWMPNLFARSSSALIILLIGHALELGLIAILLDDGFAPAMQAFVHQIAVLRSRQPLAL
jgi:hypothetical protein